MGVLHQSWGKGQVATRSLTRLATTSRMAKQPEEKTVSEAMHDVAKRPQFGGLSEELGIPSRLPIQAKTVVGEMSDSYKNGSNHTSLEMENPNRTGLPDGLKAGVENLSGYSLDNVRVHYNSPKPAQLQALAYTQGTEINVAPGEEKYLPHEVWHVVQQMQGRVKPTIHMKGIQINADGALETEADVMGRKALCNESLINCKEKIEHLHTYSTSTIQRCGWGTVTGTFTIDGQGEWELKPTKDSFQNDHVEDQAADILDDQLLSMASEYANSTSYDPDEIILLSTHLHLTSTPCAMDTTTKMSGQLSCTDMIPLRFEKTVTIETHKESTDEFVEVTFEMEHEITAKKPYQSKTGKGVKERSKKHFESLSTDSPHITTRFI